MRFVIFGWSIFMATLLIPNQGGLIAMHEKTKVYQLTYQVENVTGQITLNGFVMTEMKGAIGNGTASLNPWLVGDNELEVEVVKADSSKPAEVVLGVSVMEQGDLMSTTDKGKLFSLELKDGDFGAHSKASAAKKFTSTLNFNLHLSGGGEAKESNILAYAQDLYALFAKKDVEGILRESEVRVNDYSKAFGGVDMKTELRRFLTEELFQAKLNTLNPASLRAVAVGPNKRIWHVFNGKDELVKAESPNGSEFEMSVYIGLLDGKLKVVR